MEEYLSLKAMQYEMKQVEETMLCAPKKAIRMAAQIKMGQYDQARKILCALVENGVITEDQHNSLLERMEASMHVPLMPILPPNLSEFCRELIIVKTSKLEELRRTRTRLQERLTELKCQR